MSVVYSLARCFFSPLDFLKEAPLLLKTPWLVYVYTYACLRVIYA